MKKWSWNVCVIVCVFVCVGIGAAAAEQEVSIASMPPVVVQTVPQAGNPAVDPGLSEIRVTFSKTMLPGGWAWVKISQESFPELMGDPRFLEDKRTCVLPVKLQPARTYVIWLNSEKFTGFQDTSQHPAVPYLLVFETSGAAQ